MSIRTELAEAALEAYPEGLALLDAEERVVFWNHSAEQITGFAAVQLLGRTLPGALAALGAAPLSEPLGIPEFGSGTIVHAQHQHGRSLAIAARKILLRDPLGSRIGTAAAFHPAESGGALPHGETSDGSEVRQSQFDLERELSDRFDAFSRAGAPLGILWITVDQALGLRGTHGERACEAMLECMERTLSNSLRKECTIGRWGDGEFLVLSDEGREPILAERARLLVSLARTAEFRWWGDRVSLTLSIGAAAAEADELLPALLRRAQQGMEASLRSGGNQVSLANPCLPARSHA